jgi:hypothetical protein
MSNVARNRPVSAGGGVAIGSKEQEPFGKQSK